MKKTSKKHYTLLLLITTTLLLISSTTTTTSASTTENTEKTSNTTNTINIEISIPKPQIEKIEINKEIYDRIIIKNLPNSNNLGKPCIPVKPIKILLPPNQKPVDIEITTSGKTFLGSGYNIEIGQPLNRLIAEKNHSKPKQQKKHGTKKNIFPEKLYSTIGIHILRGYPILFINIYPLQYNQKNGSLIYYKNIHLTVKTKKHTYNSSRAIRGLLKDIRIVSQIVDNPWCIHLYKNIWNKKNNNPHMSSESIEYVIITAEELLNNARDYTFEDLAESKILRGINTRIITVEEIINNPEYWVNGTWGDNNPSNPFYQSEITSNYNKFNDTPAKIRNFIRHAYLEWGTDYVLLGGDADTYNEEDNLIPIRYLYANETGLPLTTNTSSTLEFVEEDIPSDVYYACLDGNFNYDLDNRWGENETGNDIADEDEADLLAEVWVGRACVDSLEEVSNFVMKTLNYENTDDPYLKDVLLLGEWLGFPGISEYGGNYKDLIKPYIPDNYTINTLYDRDQPNNWDKYELMDILNTQTPHIINHLGHGFVNYALRLHNQDILTLTNNKYFFIYSQTCLAGSLDNTYEDNHYQEDCAAEHFTVETPHGAFAVIMNARYGLGSENTLNSPSQAYDESFFKALFTENIKQLGRANHYSKEDNIWHINENGIRWVYYETNLFGDPESSIKNPSNLSITITYPKENGIYLLGRKIPSLGFIKKPVILGRITIETKVISNDTLQNVEFYLDNNLLYTDEEPPYQYMLAKPIFGKHTITAVANTAGGERKSDEIEVILFILL